MKSLSVIVFFLSTVILNGQDLQLLPELNFGGFSDNYASISENEIIEITHDSDFYFNFLTFKNAGNIDLIDTVDNTPYGFNFRLLKASDKKRLLLIEVEYEYISYYPIYLISESGIKKIGNLNIRLDCTNCDGYNYPLNDIVIKGNDYKIEFTFKHDLVLLDRKEFPKFKKDEIRFVFDFRKGKIEIEKNTGANKG